MIKEPRGDREGGEAREYGDARWGHLYPRRGYPQCIATT